MKLLEIYNSVIPYTKCYICDADATCRLEIQGQLPLKLFPTATVVGSRSRLHACADHRHCLSVESVVDLCTHDWLRIFLIRNGACSEGMEWFDTYQYNLKDAWKYCDNPRYMLWLVYMVGGGDHVIFEFDGIEAIRSHFNLEGLINGS